MRLAGWDRVREVRGCALNSAGNMSAIDPSVHVCISLFREMRVL